MFAIKRKLFLALKKVRKVGSHHTVKKIPPSQQNFRFTPTLEFPLSTPYSYLENSDELVLVPLLLTLSIIHNSFFLMFLLLD